MLPFALYAMERGVYAVAFEGHQRTRGKLALAPPGAHSDAGTRVVDADTRFVAPAGRWLPFSTLARRLEEAAVGRAKCARP